MSMEHDVDSDRPDWTFDPAEMTARCQEFITETIEGIGARGVVVGLSGR